MILGIFSLAYQPSKCLLYKNKHLFRLKECLYHLLSALWISSPPPQVPRKVLERKCAPGQWVGHAQPCPWAQTTDRAVGPAQIQNRGYPSPGRARVQAKSLGASDFLLITSLLPLKQNSTLSSRGSQQPAVGIQARLLKRANSSKSCWLFLWEPRAPGKYTLA